MKTLKRLMVLILTMAFLVAFLPSIHAQEGEKININTASVKELIVLKGIGPKYAESIVQYRDDKGPFSSVGDIVKVPGIGPKTFEAIKERITTE